MPCETEVDDGAAERAIRSGGASQGGPDVGGNPPSEQRRASSECKGMNASVKVTFLCVSVMPVWIKKAQAS